ncbi:HAMP domain-containing sensor histidine kinase [Patulibacter sp. SYSU D01012]|uniref:sensor histidine kinase n=1 Tax=Patulibacter sp. SYSU D01012 TaxID=2817381 RepID=UPI001B30AD2F|nr:HAMP domain-containing sensor histidine kinase [Patulibacter sp. SYSU D01012]
MSARLRLTLSYMGFLVVAGAAMLAVVLYLLHFVPEGQLTGSDGFVPNRSDLQEAVLPRAIEVLAGLAVVGLVGGWFLAGRMLRPLDRISEVARQVADGSLEHRVRLQGPRDEFRLLADAFDGMLDRVQAHAEEQRRFAANASHELRTPYTVARSVIDVALADPEGRDVDAVLHQLAATNRRGMEVVEALLALSSLDAGEPPRREPIDVAELAGEVVAELTPVARAAGVRLASALGEADIDGDPTLVRQAIANLVLNGIHHNTGNGGRVDVRSRTSDDDGGVEVQVVNTGPVVPAAALTTLAEPFVRGDGRVTGEGHRGSGLGLAIVARVAHAHEATLALGARDGGGLDVRLTFPAPQATTS